MITIKGLRKRYGTKEVLSGVSLTVPAASVFGLVGLNGAGKTTTMRAISGMIRPKSGSIIFNDVHLENKTIKQIHDLGISFITDEGNLFSGMTVKENLEMGALSLRDKGKKKERLDKGSGLSPRLGERLTQQAGLMSGG